MLAESDVGNLVIIAIIVIGMIIGRIVEYVRKQKAEQEAKERELRGTREAAGQEGASAEPEARPAAGGLQALLDALEGRGDRREAPASPEPSGRGDEVWDFDEESGRTGERVMDPATLELERDRAAEDARTIARESAAPVEAFEDDEVVILPQPSDAEAERRMLEARAPALVTAGLLAGPGGPPLRYQARRGVLWSVVLGPPRGTVPYGERGASEAPGGIV